MRTNTLSQETERVALTCGEVARALGISDRHVWALTRAGRFPAPIRLNRATRWLRADVLAHLDQLKADAEPAA